MPQIEFQTVRVDAKELHDFTRAVLVAEGVPADDAEYVAWHLVETNLRGTDSHGVARLPHYVRRLRAGSIRAKPAMRFERRALSAGSMDGDHGLGHLIMSRATDEAATLAHETGAGWVAVSNSSHCGALAPFALRLTERGMIGLVFTHVDPMVMPFGAREPFCGTNPLCFAAPGENGKTLCLDMATSIVPWNIVANAQSEGVAIPEGWAVDGAGRDTTDPGAVAALYPFGEYKGSGLGVLIDVLCAMLSGAPYGPDIPKMYGDLQTHRRLGGLVGAIRISAFANLEVFRRRVAQMAERLTQLTPAASADRVRYPGEPELEAKARREIEGIPVGVQVFAELNSFAACKNVPALEPLAGERVRTTRIQTGGEIHGD
jgi:ureidoglycolate dehydrogenase (NAD+)